MAVVKSANATYMMARSQRLTMSVTESQASTRCVLSICCRCLGLRVANATSAQAGWPHARCEATPAVSASPCQCTPPSDINLLMDILKQLYSLMMELVVLFSRWVSCVVAWVGKCACVARSRPARDFRPS
jgi:hypothetical protein